MDSPLINIGFILLVAYIFKLWLADLKAYSSGKTVRGALPGASPCSYTIILLGIAGALILVAGETAGENLLGISDQQSSMTVLFAAVAVAAGFGEELVFRGYLLVQNRGRMSLWISIIGFSLLFSLVHPYLWSFEDGSLHFEFTRKGVFSTSFIFVNSLWFYLLRISRANPTNSLWPCIAAHAASNVAVFVVKWSQGHVSGLY